MPTARLFAAIIAVIAVVSLAIQAGLTKADEATSLPHTFWIMARYFTILTNLGVCVIMARAATTGRPTGAVLLGGATLAIAMVGIVYHLLLARHLPPFSGDWWADHGLHTAVPALTVVFWATVGNRAGLTLRDPLRWLIWPVGYTAYAIIRGLIDGKYPYFFLDIGEFGVARVALNSVGLALGFLVAGYLLLALSRALPRA